MKGYCQICGTGIDVQICCSGRDCGCLGQPIDPPVCSQVCWDKIFNKEPMKKCTLRQVAEGIVATVDEKKRFGFASYLNLVTMEISNRSFPSLGMPIQYVQIIASTIPNVGKELVFKPNCPEEWVNFNTEYEYTETENYIIIKL